MRWQTVPKAHEPRLTLFKAKAHQSLTDGREELKCPYAVGRAKRRTHNYSTLNFA